MFNPNTFPHTIKFEYPYTGTPTNSVTIRAPKFGDSKVQGRNQSIARTRAGYITAYDRGYNLNAEYTWQFENVTEEERTNLIAFFDACNWAANKIKVTDWLGDVRVIRLSTNSLSQQTTSVEILDKQELIHWSFQFSFVDLTGNQEEIGIGDEVIMATALGIHIADTDTPHNPLSTVTVDDADGVVVLESFNLETYRGCYWLLTASNGTKNAVIVAYLSSDRNYDTPADATTTKGFVVEFHEDSAEVSSEVTFSADVNGSGSGQVGRLKVDVSTDGWTFRMRRIRV